MNKHCAENKLHKVLMVLCCAIPIIILGVLYLGKVQGTSWGSMLSFAAILLCPLLHLIMMPLMIRRNKKESTGENNSSCH